MLTEQDLRAQIQIRIDRDGLTRAAADLKVGALYLVKVAQGVYPVSRKLAARLGYRLVCMFVEVK